MDIWSTYEAKAKLSELIRNAQQTPQAITMRGEKTVIVLSTQEYTKLTKPQLSLVEIMQQLPKIDPAQSVSFKRDPDTTSRPL